MKQLAYVYVELKNHTESAVALINERVVIGVWIVERLALWGCLYRACAGEFIINGVVI